MLVVLKTKGNRATPSSWLPKISQHRVCLMTKQCAKGVDGPMCEHQSHTSNRWKLDERKSDPEEWIWTPLGLGTSDEDNEHGEATWPDV